MATETRVRLGAAQRRDQLLDAARRLVARESFHAVSMEAVAREAGITRPVVYNHFGDLAGLLDALVDRELGRALEQLVLPRPAPGVSARQALLDALAGYLRAVAADPVTWRLVLTPVEGAPDSLQEKIALGRRLVLGQLTRTVASELGPELGSPDPELTARLLSAAADDAARAVLADPVRYPVERLVAHAGWVLGRMA